MSGCHPPFSRIKQKIFWRRRIGQQDWRVKGMIVNTNSGSNKHVRLFSIAWQRFYWRNFRSTMVTSSTILAPFKSPSGFSVWYPTVHLHWVTNDCGLTCKLALCRTFRHYHCTLPRYCLCSRKWSVLNPAIPFYFPQTFILPSRPARLTAPPVLRKCLLPGYI